MACHTVHISSPHSSTTAVPYDFSSKPKGLVPITGGPSSGKTAILDQLASAGHFTFREAATGIIQNLQEHFGVETPWEHDELEELITSTQAIGCRVFARHTAPIGFMERCEVDPITYRRFYERPSASHIVEKYKQAIAAESPYHKCAFAIAPLSTFEETAVRGQENGKKELQTRLYKALVAGYEEAGFEVVVVPPEVVEPRSLNKPDQDLAVAESIRRRTNIILERCGLKVISA
jgi:predicted ATPase